MTRHLSLAGALLAVTFTVACTDDRAAEPTSPSLMAGATCKYSDVKKFARNLFGPNTDGYSLAQDMSGFAKDSPQATAKAFEIFAAIAAKRTATADFSPFVSDAANLTIETINCANVASTGEISLAAFTAALGPTGGYGVPGPGAGSILAKDGQASVNSPSAGFGSWLGGNPGLFYGRIPSSAAAPGESQVGFTGRTVYDWSLLRPVGAGALNGKGSVSLCVAYEDTDPSVNPAQFRVQKAANILEIQTKALACDPLLLSSASATPTGFFARVLRQAGTWLAPEPLHATLAKSGTSPTGGAGNFSLFYAVNPNSVNLSFTVPPVDGTMSDIPGANGGDVTVLVQGAGGTPWEGVSVKVFGINNNGAMGQFVNNVVPTNAQGLAVFPDLGVTQPGGYTMYASTVADATDPDVTAFAADTTDVGVSIIVRPN